ncbi:MAG: hypothetical protein HY694_07430 [Deltaproteobacteria bacterium]|nr:hypothetical protein [Deltaproteobacteria bacterium]
MGLREKYREYMLGRMVKRIYEAIIEIITYQNHATLFVEASTAHPHRLLLIGIKDMTAKSAQAARKLYAVLSTAENRRYDADKLYSRVDEYLRHQPDKQRLPSCAFEIASDILKQYPGRWFSTTHVDHLFVHRDEMRRIFNKAVGRCAGGHTRLVFGCAACTEKARGATVEASEATGLSISVRCGGCSREYTLGADAIVITREGVRTDLQGAITIGEPPTDNEDYPDGIHALDRGWNSLEPEAASDQEIEIARVYSYLASGRRRWWRCQACSYVQLYKV